MIFFGFIDTSKEFLSIIPKKMQSQGVKSGKTDLAKMSKFQVLIPFIRYFFLWIGDFFCELESLSLLGLCFLSQKLRRPLKIAEKIKGQSINDVTHCTSRTSAKRLRYRRYSISLFCKMGNKGEGEGLKISKNVWCHFWKAQCI